MARSPITWHSVSSAGQAGNPSSSMAAAISGFSQAGSGALDMVDSIRKGKDIQNEQLTQQTIANVLASGKPLDASTLQDFAPGVDTSKVLESVYGVQKDKSLLETAAQGREIGAQELEDLKFKNAPEQREFERKRQEQELNLAGEELRLRELELKRRQATDQREIARLDGIAAVQKGYNSEDEGGLRGQAKANVEKNWENTVRSFINSDKFKSLSPAEKEDQIQAWETNKREELIQAEMGKLAPSWFAEQQSKYGLTETDLGETTYGRQYQEIRGANSLAIAQNLQTELTQRRKERTRAANDFDAGDLSSVIPSNNGYKYAPTAADQKGNKLTESAMALFLKDELDIQLDSEELNKAKSLLRTVGGNKAKFASIMEDSTERASFRVLGNDDNVDWSKAKTRGEVAASILRGLLKSKAEEDLGPWEQSLKAAKQ